MGCNRANLISGDDVGNQAQLTVLLRSTERAHALKKSKCPCFATHTKSSQATGTIVEHVAIELFVNTQALRWVPELAVCPGVGAAN